MPMPPAGTQVRPSISVMTPDTGVRVEVCQFPCGWSPGCRVESGSWLSLAVGRAAAAPGVVVNARLSVRGHARVDVVGIAGPPPGRQLLAYLPLHVVDALIRRRHLAAQLAQQPCLFRLA